MAHGPFYISCFGAFLILDAIRALPTELDPFLDLLFQTPECEKFLGDPEYLSVATVECKPYTCDFPRQLCMRPFMNLTDVSTNQCRDLPDKCLTAAIGDGSLNMPAKTAPPIPETTATTPRILDAIRALPRGLDPFLDLLFQTPECEKFLGDPEYLSVATVECKPYTCDFPRQLCMRPFMNLTDVSTNQCRDLPDKCLTAAMGDGSLNMPAKTAPPIPETTATTPRTTTTRQVPPTTTEPTFFQEEPSEQRPMFEVKPPTEATPNLLPTLEEIRGVIHEGSKGAIPVSADILGNIKNIPIKETILGLIKEGVAKTTSGAVGAGLNPAVAPNIGAGISPPIGSGVNPPFLPGTIPSIGSGISPSIGSGTIPSIGSGINPSIGSGISPSIGSGTIPSIGSGINPSIGSGISPSIGSGISPSIGSGISPSIGSGISPGLLPGASSQIGANINPGVSSSINPSIVPGINSPIGTATNPALGANVGGVSGTGAEFLQHFTPDKVEQLVGSLQKGQIPPGYETLYPDQYSAWTPQGGTYPSSISPYDLSGLRQRLYAYGRPHRLPFTGSGFPNVHPGFSGVDPNFPSPYAGSRFPNVYDRPYYRSYLYK